MRPADPRAVFAAALLSAAVLAACSSSGGGHSTQTPTAPATPTSSASTTKAPTTAQLNAFPLIVSGVGSKTNAKLNKLVPLLPGVQNTTYDSDGKTVRVFMKKNADANERAVVISQLKKATGKTAAVESKAPPITISPTVARSS